ISLSLGLLLAPVIQVQTLCRPLTGDASALLHRAADVTGLSGARGRLLHFQGFDVVSNDYQSDRPYPPYISSVGSFDSWFDPATGADLSKTRVAIAGTGGAGPTPLGCAT